ncbi:hypothetical protein LNO78_04595 [Klebsiella pneumoniae subsp. pneumoniae]|nr:hypothetical protein [Klebsiella pneumoniae subsp. pneumoniae]
MENYAKAKASFYKEIKEISVQLYMSRVLGLGVEFPTNNEIFDKIEKDKVTLKIKEIDSISERLHNLSEDEKKYHEVIKALDDDKLTRGKYVYHFVSEWLMRIKKYINSRIENLNNEHKSNNDNPPANDKKIV